jgi:glycosyltransferase involved in cell wall biosynthesis
MPETGGNAALYINPNNADELCNAMQAVAADIELRNKMIAKGITHALKFTPQNTAAAVMNLYQSL